MKYISEYKNYEELISESHIDEYPLPDDPAILYVSTEIVDIVKEKYKKVMEELNSDLEKQFLTNDKKKLNIDKLLRKTKRKGGYNLIDQSALHIIKNMDSSSLKSLNSDKIDMSILSELHSDVSFVDGDDIILVTTAPSNESHSPLIKVVLGKYKYQRNIQCDICITNANDVYIISHDGHADTSILVIKKETYEDFANKPLNI